MKSWELSKIFEDEDPEDKERHSNGLDMNIEEIDEALKDDYEVVNILDVCNVIFVVCNVIFVVCKYPTPRCDNQLLPTFLVVNQKGKGGGLIPLYYFVSYASIMQQKSSLF